MKKCLFFILWITKFQFFRICDFEKQWFGPKAWKNNLRLGTFVYFFLIFRPTVITLCVVLLFPFLYFFLNYFTAFDVGYLVYGFEYSVYSWSFFFSWKEYFCRNGMLHIPPNAHEIRTGRCCLLCFPMWLNCYWWSCEGRSRLDTPGVIVEEFGSPTTGPGLIIQLK